MEAIVVEGLSKSFGELRAVDRISFNVRRGEIFGFLGPNGAGKTTTVRMLTGIIKPDTGRATVLGYDVVKGALRVKERIGVLPEVANPYPDLSAWRNVMLAASLYGIPRKEAEQRAKVLLKEFGIYERRESKVKTFSKGMKQRLMLCIALVSGPELLFLDEPTSGLDVQSARMIRQKILELQKEGKTVFLTSHNMQEVDMLCDRIGIINRGKIVTVDTPENLRRKIGGTLVVEVSFDKPPGEAELKTSNLLELDVERAGKSLKIYTTKPHAAICTIVDFAKQKGLEITSLTVCSPPLEDVFVRLTGGFE
ncbi:MAG: ABC-type multidrug transport system [Candidatus Alkanophagales archaeon MCA70_species_2]|nr:ABC-type multidrug transport system [Candidatus Alkanophaga liquidiphilum]